tara:strand:- start:178 stop:783 length:606 start_codon:yes stop_codon:yes gene_type:complete
MNSSEKINELATALCKAQAAMGGAVKDSANPFFKSSYADLTSVIKAIKQPFADNDLSYTQFPVSDENGIGVVTRLMHNSGQWMELGYTLPIVKKDPQAAGSAITYARRYALQSMAGIPTADDDAESSVIRGDHKKAINVIDKAAINNVIDDAQLSTLTDLLDSTGADVRRFCEHYEIASTKDLMAAQFDQAIAKLEAKASR